MRTVVYTQPGYACAPCGDVTAIGFGRPVFTAGITTVTTAIFAAKQI